MISQFPNCNDVVDDAKSFQFKNIHLFFLLVATRTSVEEFALCLQDKLNDNLSSAGLSIAR